MDRHFLGINWLSSQIQTVNPIFILIMLPLFSYWLYPFVEKFIRLTPLRKMGAGLFVTAASFFLVAMIQKWIDGGARPSISLAGLGVCDFDRGRNAGFADSPRVLLHARAGQTQIARHVHVFLAVSLGNQFTAAVNFFIQNPDGSVKLQGTSYFMFFVWVMLGTAVLFAIITPFYKGRTYLQDQTQVAGDAEPALGFAVQPEA